MTTSTAHAPTHSVSPVRGIGHGLILAGRSIAKIRKNPATLADVTIGPIIFLVMFVFLFEELAKLNQQPGRDIVISGSSTLTAGLLHTGLLDEVRIMVNPVVLGQGKSLFGGAGKTGLKLLETRQFTSGNVLLCYQPITN